MKRIKELSNDAKIAIVLLCAFLVVLLMYAVNGYYLNRNGTLETEYIVNYSEHSALTVSGFAVRDENRTVSGKNACLLDKNDDYVYVPVISDSENVSKNGVIALAFSSKEEADAYTEQQDLKNKLASIKELKRSADLSHSNVLFLNSQLNSNVSAYLECVASSDISDIETYIENITNNITSKQMAIGNKIDYDSIINDYEKKISALKGSYKIIDKITSPYAGYFVSTVDGYEGAASFKDVENKKVNNGEGGRLISAESNKNAQAYGKIILQHTWYYVFDISVENSSILKTGYWEHVSFDELGIENIDMQVYDISDAIDGKVTVTLKCTSMNEELSKIRKETAKIVLDEYKGFKISSEALTENEDGITGVYAVVGNIMKFSPVEILLYGDGYVVVTGKKMLRDEEYKASGYYHVLRQYDKIIVKGLNLKDGTIVD